MRVIRFVRESQDENYSAANNIFVEYKTSLQDPNNLDENFRISDPIYLSSYIESKLFHFLDRKYWTLNELIFFCKNNNICAEIREGDNTVVRYGKCDDSVCTGFKVNDKCLLINNKAIKI